MDLVTHGAAPGAATAVVQTVVTHRGSSERAPERCGGDLIYKGIEKAMRMMMEETNANQFTVKQVFNFILANWADCMPGHPKPFQLTGDSADKMFGGKQAKINPYFKKKDIFVHTGKMGGRNGWKRGAYWTLADQLPLGPSGFLEDQASPAARSQPIIVEATATEVAPVGQPLEGMGPDFAPAGLEGQQVDELEMDEAMTVLDGADPFDLPPQDEMAFAAEPAAPAAANGAGGGIPPEPFDMHLDDELIMDLDLDLDLAGLPAAMPHAAGAQADFDIL